MLALGLIKPCIWWEELSGSFRAQKRGKTHQGVAGQGVLVGEIPALRLRRVVLGAGARSGPQGDGRHGVEAALQRRPQAIDPGRCTTSRFHRQVRILRPTARRLMIRLERQQCGGGNQAILQRQQDAHGFAFARMGYAAGPGAQRCTTAIEIEMQWEAERLPTVTGAPAGACSRPLAAAPWIEAAASSARQMPAVGICTR